MKLKINGQSTCHESPRTRVQNSRIQVWLSVAAQTAVILTDGRQRREKGNRDGRRGTEMEDGRRGEQAGCRIN